MAVQFARVETIHMYAILRKGPRATAASIARATLSRELVIVASMAATSPATRLETGRLNMYLTIAISSSSGEVEPGASASQAVCAAIQQAM